MFELIKNIEIEENTWKDKLFITSDIDWASDEVLDFTINLFEKYNTKCTFFATHQTVLINNLSSNFDVGLHPNFNFLLQGDFRYGKSYSEVIDYYEELLGRKKLFRSHSLTINSYIKSEIANRGYIINSNEYIPFSSNIELKPYIDFNNVISIPHYWEDDLCMIKDDGFNLEEIINKKGLKVFDIHPIHIFLNTENMIRYENAREYFQNYSQLKKHVNTSSYGTRDFLIDLMKGAI